MSSLNLGQYYDGLKIGCYTILMTLGLEIFSWSSVRNLIQSSKENQKLYQQAVVANIVNILGLGPVCIICLRFILSVNNLYYFMNE